MIGCAWGITGWAGSLLDAATLASLGASTGVGTGATGSTIPLKLDLLNEYVPVFLVAFLVTLCATPLMRRLAIANGIIDRPNEARKAHKFPIAYLGGVAVYLGIMAGIAFSYIAPYMGWMNLHAGSAIREEMQPVPLAILFGLTIIMLVGLLDDVLNISPWQKVGGQLLAAAALAYYDIGVKLAAQVLTPIGELIGNPKLEFVLLSGNLHIDLIYWCGTAVIALFVLGACNASNLIDGLDGLLSGVTVICNAGLLAVALGLAVLESPAGWGDGDLDAARIILCLAIMGGAMGFLPHNFNQATIFLGDAGSLLMGYATITVVLTLGNTGKTALVLAGLIIYGVPIMDTTLAIVRRKMSGQSISAGDDQHLHHILKRSLGVKGAVLVLYGIGIGFAVLGVSLTMGRDRITYLLTIIFASFIGVAAIKVARRKQFEEQSAKLVAAERAAELAKGHRASGPQPSPANGSLETSPALAPSKPA